MIYIHKQFQVSVVHPHSKDRKVTGVMLLALLVGVTFSACGGEIDFLPGESVTQTSTFQPVLTANPGLVLVPSGQVGTTSISWNGRGRVVYITVSRDGAAETLFAIGTTGNAKAPWILGGSTYVFRMRSAPHGGSLLLSVTVTTQDPGALLSANPSVVVVAPGQVGATLIRWSSTGSVSYITVSHNGSPEQLFATGLSGQASAPWIIGGHSYVFRMRTAPHGGSLLATATVSTQAPAPLSYSEFAPYLARYGGQIGSHGGQVYSQWASLPKDNDLIDIAWGSPSNWHCTQGTEGCPTIEEHGIRRGCSPHGDWAWLYAYRDDHAGQRYRIRTTRAVLTRGGVSYDITGQCGTEGQPYALETVPPDSYHLAVWGDILHLDGSVGRRFFWQETISPPAQVSNPCWTTGSPSRLSLRQDEAWWDSYLGWSIGGGVMGTNGEPNGAGVWYGRYQTMARNTGFGWTLGTRSSPGASFSISCLHHQWSW